jgi:hypothetical protein
VGWRGGREKEKEKKESGREKKERKSPALVDGARRGKELQGDWWVGLANALQGVLFGLCRDVPPVQTF